MSDLKRKADKLIQEEVLIKKKIHGAETNPTFPNNERNFESSDYYSTISSSTEQQLPIDNHISPEEPKTFNGPRRNQKSSNDDIHKAYISDPAAFIDTYKVVKYKGNIYHLGDILLIRNEADSNNDFICKLLKIIRPIKPEDFKILAFLEVQWYYKKTDLPKKYIPTYDKCISKYEIFLSSHKDFIMVDCINGLCNVLTLEDYDKLESINPNTFFTRAEYDVVKKKINPPIESWAKHCTCLTPINPDYMYIQCDKCDSWYHIECVQLSDDKAKTLEKWLCYKCDNNNKGCILRIDKKDE